MPLRPRLLLVGDDIRQLYTWEMLLGIQFAIDISAGLSEALKLLQSHRFELIVVFQASESWRRLAGFAFRQIPAPKILVVTATEGERLEWADAVICRHKTPYELMTMCAEMFGMATRTTPRGFSARSSPKVVAIS
jgi:hypothetical protein